MLNNPKNGTTERSIVRGIRISKNWSDFCQLTTLMVGIHVIYTLSPLENVRTVSDSNHGADTSLTLGLRTTPMTYNGHTLTIQVEGLQYYVRVPAYDLCH